LFNTGAAVAYFFTARRERLVRDCCIEAVAAGIGIPAFSISVRYGTVPEHSGSGLGFLIPVPGWFQHLHSCS
jgi:hypothetical protein